MARPSGGFFSAEQYLPNSTCLADAPAEFEGSLQNILAANAARPVVVAGHHPLASSSEHGGHFSLRQHLVPLTDAAPWAWLPLPIVGSLYPAYRALGFASQDLSSGIYTATRELMGRAMHDHPPLLMTAGWVQLEALADGRIRIAVVEVDGERGRREATAAGRPAAGGSTSLIPAAPRPAVVLSRRRSSRRRSSRRRPSRSIFS